MISHVVRELGANEQVLLLEVACGVDSILTSTMQELTKSVSSAQRLSIWNDYDISTGRGVKGVLDKIDLCAPELVWLSPECGPYSVMQNINQRTAEQRSDLENKRKQALKQYMGCAIIYQYCVQRGTHVVWELSQSCQAWRLPVLQNLIKRYDPYFAIVRGCQVNLRNPQKHFISKGWKLMTTHEPLSIRMHLPCHCAPGTYHAPCEGSVARSTAYYTREFALRACREILRGGNREQWLKELKGKPTGGEVFGLGTVCVCEHVKQHGSLTNCGHCTQTLQQEVLTVDKRDQVLRQPLREEDIKRRLYLLHSATGHGSIPSMVQALKRKGVAKQVLDLAQSFRCPVCEERSKPRPRNLASLEPLPPKFMTVAADVGHWYHPATKEKWQFILMVDEGSRFRVGRMILQGKQKHISAGQFVQIFQEAWVSYFGHPQTLRLDPDGAFRSHELASYCDRHQIYLDLIPGEAHWKLSVCERSIQAIKHVMASLAAESPALTAEQILAESVRTLNHRENVRGFTPVQYVLGRAPDEHGRFFNPARDLETPGELPMATETMERDQRLRLSAEKAFLDWVATERIQRATHSKHRRVLDFSAGDLVFIRRKQLTGEDAQQNKTGQGRFVGPARVLAVEQSRDDQGHLRPGSSVWLVRGRRLLKCCPEQLRHASEREVILTELHDSRETPTWDFPIVAEELGNNDYEDVQEQPTEAEWRRAGNPLHEWQPSCRMSGKQQPSEPVAGSQKKLRLAPPAPVSASRPRSRSPPWRPVASGPSSGSGLHRPSEPADTGFQAAPHWTELVHESYFSEAANTKGAQDMVHHVEIEMPSSKASTERALKDLNAFFVGALERRAVEISERRMTPEERKQFDLAKSIEVTNFLAAKAFEALPANHRFRREDAVNMRWILTWKVKDDGTKKAKARAVLQGFQDPKYEERATHSPTTTRQTRQMQLQIAASMGFSTKKGDVTGAFLQSRPYPDDLLCIPCAEICTAMGLAPGSLTKVRKACYGLVDAPLEWYRSISTFFSKLGLRRCWSDPCCWTLVQGGKLRGIISGHVDDFLFSGSPTDEVWLAIEKAIKEEFRWSDWEEGRFVQCGVLIEQEQDGSYSLSQKHYVESIPAINIRASRKRERNAATDDLEKTQLRGLLGGISWFSQQVAPHFAADVGLLLSEVNHSTVDTLFRANRLLDQVRNMKEQKLKIHKIDLNNVVLVAWVDAANQNRISGGSAQGVVISAAPKSLMSGQCVPVTLLSWQSSKIARVCSSPGASEAMAAVHGEDLLYFCRFQLGEMLGFPLKIQDPNPLVNRIPGCLVTDSRNVFDKLRTEVLSPKGAERRVDITLMRIKDAQNTNEFKVRWVHSEAQLANGLTKGKELRQLSLFYDMDQCWRIVEDPTMSSARRRKAQGQTPLENTSTSSSSTQLTQSDNK